MVTRTNHGAEIPIGQPSPPYHHIWHSHGTVRELILQPTHAFDEEAIVRVFMRLDRHITDFRMSRTALETMVEFGVAFLRDHPC